MFDLPLRLAILVAMTHGFRALGRLAGPRWGGLVLGLPCSTAVLLIGYGLERGVEHAVGTAEGSLLGLVAAVAMPLVYAQALGSGWRLPGAISAAVGAYLVVAAGVSHAADGGAVGCLALSLMAVLTACHVAGRIRVATERGRRCAPSRLWVLGCRMLVPMAYLWFVMTVQDSAGNLLAGLLSTFPGMSLTVLVVTHLEAGPVAASRLARALPPGNLSMISFLAVFRFGSPQLGLAWGTALGYAAALATLVVVERIFRRPLSAPAERASARRRSVHRQEAVGRVGPVASVPLSPDTTLRGDAKSTSQAPGEVLTSRRGLRILNGCRSAILPARIARRSEGDTRR